MRLTHLLLPALVALIALPAAVRADDARCAPVRERMQKFVDSGDLSGAVAVVGRKAGVVCEVTVGVADLDARTPMRPDTLFRIASMTKPITAIAVMILTDEGKLGVEDPVEKYLPEFKGQMLRGREGQGPTKPARPITVRDLLTHTSGLTGVYTGDMAGLYQKRHHTLAESTAAIAKQPLVSEPGAQWSYCNPGIDTLGRVVEVVSGERFEDFLQKRVFDPLGMRDTTFYPTADQLKRTAVTYRKQDGKLGRAGNLVVDFPKGAKHPVPAGGLFSTGPDLARLYRMMLNKGELDGKRILSEKAVAEMTKVQTGDLKAGFVPGTGWGYGWGVVREPKGVTATLSPGTFGHGGAFGTQAWVDPTRDVFVVLLIQRSDLPNSDASPMRQALHEAAAEVIKK